MKIFIVIQRNSTTFLKNQTTRSKIMHSFGCNSINVEISKYRYFHSSYDNALGLNHAVLISSRTKPVEFLQESAAEEFMERFERPDTKWKIVQISNIVFYVNHQPMNLLQDQSTNKTSSSTIQDLLIF